MTQCSIYVCVLRETETETECGLNSFHVALGLDQHFFFPFSFLQMLVLSFTNVDFYYHIFQLYGNCTRIN
jgi:hypothetical protein